MLISSCISVCMKRLRTQEILFWAASNVNFSPAHYVGPLLRNVMLQGKETAAIENIERKFLPFCNITHPLKKCNNKRTHWDKQTDLTTNSCYMVTTFNKLSRNTLMYIREEMAKDLDDWTRYFTNEEKWLKIWPLLDCSGVRIQQIREFEGMGLHPLCSLFQLQTAQAFQIPIQNQHEELSNGQT